jgi:cbb3-type cytochrome c oxidase subunit II
MNRTFLVIVGVFLTIAFSLSGLVLIPNWQFQEHQPVRNARDGSQYPAPYYGLALQGRDVYVDQGCAYCHTQQVRPKGYGADIRRNWGNRRTVARDYMYEYPILLGTMRTGPDLANIGARQPARDWHYLHLYNPQITSARSCPATRTCSAPSRPGRWSPPARSPYRRPFKVRARTFCPPPAANNWWSICAPKTEPSPFRRQNNHERSPF